MTRRIQLLAALMVCWSMHASAGTRTYSMGFAVSTNDPTSVSAAFQYIKQADIVVIQDGSGIPWDSAYNANFQAYPSDYLQNLQDIASRLQQLPSTTKVVLYANLLNGWRNTIADYLLPGGAVPIAQTPWASMATSFNDPAVLQAYLNHLGYLISLFHPNYVAYGAEVNMLPAETWLNPSAWTNFVSAASTIYSMVHANYPGVPVFCTVQAEYFNLNRSVQTGYLNQIWGATDYIAVTTYPYVFGWTTVSSIPSDYYSSLIKLAGGKPFALAEVGWPSQPVFYPDPLPSGQSYTYYVYEDQVRQWAYLNRMLMEATSNKAVFVDWYAPQDMSDQQWAAAATNTQVAPIIRLFRNVGLWDQNGSPRWAASLWNFYFQGLTRALQ